MAVKHVYNDYKFAGAGQGDERDAVLWIAVAI